MNRWFAASIDGGNGNTIFLARSDTSDPTQTWQSVEFVGDSTGTHFNDYPTLGVDADGVYVATNNFGATFDVSIYSVPKADLLAATPSIANLTRFEALPSGQYGSGIQAALDMDPSDGNAVLLSASGGSVFRADITGAGAAGATLSPATPIAGVPAFLGAPPARQPSGQTIENVSPRFTGNVVEVGDSLWAAHPVQGSFSNSAIRWYEIEESTSTLLQFGTIEDANLDYLDPSIAANAAGEVLIGATVSGPSQFASAVGFVGATTAGTTTFGPQVMLRPGNDNYFLTFGSGRNRWAITAPPWWTPWTPPPSGPSRNLRSPAPSGRSTSPKYRSAICRKTSSLPSRVPRCSAKTGPAGRPPPRRI